MEFTYASSSVAETIYVISYANDFSCRFLVYSTETQPPSPHLALFCV